MVGLYDLLSMSQTSRITWNYSSGLPLCLAMENDLRLRANATLHKMKIRLALRFSECRRSDSKSPQKPPYVEIDFLPNLGLKSIEYVTCFTSLEIRVSQEVTRNAGTGTHSSFCFIALRKFSRQAPLLSKTSQRFMLTASK